MTDEHSSIPNHLRGETVPNLIERLLSRAEECDRGIVRNDWNIKDFGTLLREAANEIAALKSRIEIPCALASPAALSGDGSEPVAFVDPKGNLLVPEGSPLPAMLKALPPGPFGGEVLPLFTRPSRADAVTPERIETVFSILWPQQEWNGEEGFCRAVAEKVVRTLALATAPEGTEKQP